MQHTQRNRRHARLVMQSKTEIHKARTQKNTTHAINSMLCVHCIFCVHALQFFDLCHMSSVHCVAYGSMETDLKSVFIGLHAVSKLLYATHATQWMLRNGSMVCEAIKNRNTKRMHAKNTTQAINSILCVAFFVCIHCVHCIRCMANDSLETNL